MKLPYQLAEDLAEFESKFGRPMTEAERKCYVDAWLRAYESLLDGKSGEGDGRTAFGEPILDWIAIEARERAMLARPTGDELWRHRWNKQRERQRQVWLARHHSGNPRKGGGPGNKPRF